MRPDRAAVLALRRRQLLGCSVAGLLGWGGSTARANVPVWGAPRSRPMDTAPAALKPGEWVWGPADGAPGPLVMLVGLTEQRAYVYRNGILAAVSTVSTGKPGHATPTGVFTILQKDKDHRSSLYNSAPMPYQERLTWDGIALHAGGLPGFPESHGCVHLPTEFARRLFGVTHIGMTVVIDRRESSPALVDHPMVISPVRPDDGRRIDTSPLASGEASRWTPEAAPAGPVSLLLSTADRRLVVLRNGIEIGRAAVTIRQDDRVDGTHAFVKCAGFVDGVFPDYPDGRAPAWMAIALPGQEAEAGHTLDRADIDSVVVPPAFVAQVVPLLDPGSVLVVTPAPLAPHTTGVALRVADAVPPG